ncbi:MAG: ethanolamine ammonia-lyase subunit EutC [Hyphomicrobiales bacterium]|nr:ethanolamine ammonia-lyase subunit EutC [Hyphomicrobiales bacterium]
MSDFPAKADRWTALKAATPARIGLPRAGQGLALSEVLAFQLAHARARDAVHAALDVEAIAQVLGPHVLHASSAAPARDCYLRRPDLGRRLADTTALALADAAGDPVDLAIVIADGLSATAVQAHAAPLALRVADLARAAGLTLAPFVIATQARVALGDHIAAQLKTRAVVMLIGERPGLSAVDSLGAYFTHNARPGVSTDADRNCVSNIRDGGLPLEDAAGRLFWLITEARRRGASGVALKDESGLTSFLPA